MSTRARPKRKERPQKQSKAALRDDACPNCGSAMRERSAALRLPVNGEEIAVRNAAHLRCPKCHEVVLRMDQARKLRESALNAYRSRFDLLSADEIRSIRERYRLTQGQLARLLRLGGNTISRWESGRNVQTAAMDVLLRLIRDIPESLRYLKKHAA